MVKKKRHKASNSNPWSDRELQLAIDSYVYMLRLELSGVIFSVEDMAHFLTEGPLPKRNSASIRYRMRNISYVLKNKQLPILSAYSPVPRVGAGVQKRIEKILGDRSELINKIFSKKHSIQETNIREVYKKLDLLEELVSLEDEKSIAGIGHNNPPEPIDHLPLDFGNVKKVIYNIKIELSSDKPDQEKIKKEQSLIIKLGLWATTLFIGGGFATTGEKILGPHIIDTLETLASYISNLA